jgi:FAD/FMN-containing dehydrogenase
MTTSVGAPQAAVEQLAEAMGGDVLAPDSPGYEEARNVWNGLMDRRPALIARCSGVADVMRAVDFARANAMEVSVRGGGHSAQGYGTNDGGLVIDLSRMKGIRVDPESHTVRAEAGLTWAEFDRETEAFGLAVTGGRFSTTGIAGLALGSGSGWLERKCGLTGDNLLSADVVTADGRFIKCSPRENSDLFWGLRGGGGNFGIVTSFVFRLHEVGPIIYGGMLVADPARAGEVLRFMRDYMPDAPDDLGAAVAFVSAPPEPFVPPEMHFKPILGLVICWTGDHEEGERVIAPIREVAQPMMDMVQPMPYSALQTMLDGGASPGTNAYLKADFMMELGEDAIEKLIAHGAARPGPMCQLLLEPMGGAIARKDPDETALGRRDVPWCYHALALWMEPGQEVHDAHVEWAKRLSADLEPETTEGVYLNFTSDEGEDRVRSTYGPEKYAKLVELKDKYDPGNMFHLNQNIKPSIEATARAEGSG